VREDNIAEINCHKWKAGQVEECLDYVSVESPLEISIFTQEDDISKPISITMRTPGNDVELALGFLYGEGIFSSIDSEELMNIKVVSGLEDNRVVVHMPAFLEIDSEYLSRNFYTTSSCGVCGKSSLNALLLTVPPSTYDVEIKLTPTLINSLPVQMREQQSDFETTGGTHASALFDKEGALMYFAEDVGRHNAMDKVIGSAILNGDVRSAQMVCFSGRTSFELVQKAAMAGIKVIVCIGAPSSLAIDLSNTFDIVLIGFHRGNEFNVYSGHNDIFFTKD